MSKSEMKILLVEDNPDEARLVNEYLRGMSGIELIAVNTLALGIEHLRINPVDLVLLDLGLPDSRGLDTLRAMVAAAPIASVVVLTGDDDEATAKAAMGAGAQDCLVKGQVDGRSLIRLTGYAVERKRTTEAKAALEEQLRASQKMEAIGLLAGGVAHDFNNLLGIIIGYTEMGLEKVGESDPLKENLQQVLDASRRAAELTRQLLAFGRKQIMQPVLLNPNQIILGLEKMLRRIIGEDIELTQTLARDLGFVCADPNQIEQVLMNLVVNARDAMPAGGRLIIGTSNTEIDQTYASLDLDLRPGLYVLLTVTDTGTGMDEQTKGRVFEPFFTTKEKGKGTGLGLSTAYGIVKQSGGYISVSSEPRQGTTFKVFLPREIEATTTADKSDKILRTYKGSETVFIVEDEDALREVTRKMLEEAGYKVITASGGAEALQASEGVNDAVHLLLTDVVMPLMSGKELALKLAKSRPEMKVLFMSGYAGDAIGHNGIPAERIHFIAKPFTFYGLTQKVREVLDESIIRPAN